MSRRLGGFQKPVSQPAKRVGVAVVTYEGDTARCSCGWGYAHQREKVREDAVDRHLRKKHNGRGVRI
jgi:hypothetical protein